MRNIILVVLALAAVAIGIGFSRMPINPGPGPDTPTGAAAPAPPSVQTIIANAKDIGGAKAIPDQYWPQLLKFFGMPKTTDGFAPLSGKYAGTSFVKESKAVKPGIAAGLAVPNAIVSGLTGVDAISGIWSFLTTPASWLRILKYIAGAALIFFALKELTGAQVPDVVKRAIP